MPITDEPREFFLNFPMLLPFETRARQRDWRRKSKPSFRLFTV